MDTVVVALPVVLRAVEEAVVRTSQKSLVVAKTWALKLCQHWVPETAFVSRILGQLIVELAQLIVTRHTN